MEQPRACLWMTGGGLQAWRTLATNAGGERRGGDRGLTVALRPQLKLHRGGAPNQISVLYSFRGTEDELACCPRRAGLMRMPRGGVLQGTENLVWTQQAG